MKVRKHIVRTFVGLILLFGVPAIMRSQNTNNLDAQFAENAAAIGKLRDLTYVSPTYRAEVIHKIIGEANAIARELHLSENLPITESDLIAEYIPPSKLAGIVNALGNITTSNYIYYISAGNKFSYLVKTDLDKDYPAFRKRSRWPISKMDTNSAYQLAIQWLSELSIDVHALTNACRTHITAMMVEGGRNFVPVYWVVLAAARGRRPKKHGLG